MLEKIAARLTINAAIIALLVLALVAQTVRIEGFKFWPLSIHGLKADLKSARDELEKLSSAKNTQKQTTQDKIAETRVIYRDANKVAERIEKAPTVEGCKTPPEIMGADL